MKQKRQQPQYTPITSLYRFDDNETAHTLDKDHPDIMANLWHFACTHSEDLNQCYHLLVVVLDRCDKAIQFERSRTSKRPPRQRHDNRNERQAIQTKEYVADAEQAAESLRQVFDFMRNYENTPGLNEHLFQFFAQKCSSKIVPSIEGKSVRFYDAVCSTIRGLQSALTKPLNIGGLHHYAYTYGPLHFQYPVYWRGGELPSTPRVLALQLTTVFRMYSTGRLELTLYEGYEMTSDGKPMHKLVDCIVTALFPDLCKESPEIAKPVERYFKREHPRLNFMHWPESKK